MSNARSNAGRIAALTRWSREDPRPALAHARASFDAQWEAKVDPESQLDPAERLRRAKVARRLYFLRLAEKSARARRKEAAG